ncbi:MAG: hypothetical protein IPL46_20240 [Saprospiraceae bacterium]|nr:hypothetical protein [Saprospiraceae bacterium]
MADQFLHHYIFALSWQRYFRLCLILFNVLALGSILSCSIEKETKDKDGPGFLAAIQNDSILDLTLSFSQSDLEQHLEDERKIDGTMTLGREEPVPIRLASRGVTRKKICDFPPLHVYLPDSMALVLGWGAYKKYKLVTHCHKNNDDDDLLLREFLVYQMYHLITPVSLKVQLCRSWYYTESDSIRHFSFFIEDEDEMSYRVGGDLLEDAIKELPPVDKVQYQNLVLFQYMIGNTDWNLTQRHNIKFIKIDDNPYLTPVPYDFDYSGLVNAPYATPYPTLPIKHVRERLWQYRGQSEDDLSVSVSLFIAKKHELLQLIDLSNYVSDSSKKDMLDYVLSFYQQIEQPGGIGQLMKMKSKLE